MICAVQYCNVLDMQMLLVMCGTHRGICTMVLHFYYYYYYHVMCSDGGVCVVVQYSSPCISVSRDTVRSNANISSCPVNMLA